MSSMDLMSPFFGGGLKSIKFFNGRLLSGEDLTTEQAASKEARERLGIAVGDGVVSGLEVKTTSAATTPTVTVSPGVAINRDGCAFRLSSAVDVSLFKPTAPPSSTSNGVTAFAGCGPAAPGVYLSGTGIYLLTIAPIEGTQGRAPVVGLQDAARCNAKYIVEGVQFRLIALTSAFTAAELLDSRLQNLVAAKCFGFDVDPLVDPFGAAPPPRGIIEALRPNALSDDEVPLAVIHWQSAPQKTGIGFVDMWAARRRASRRDAADDSILPIGAADVARHEAILLQFQEQLAKLFAGTPETVAASGVFRYLPPVGLLPLLAGPIRGFTTQFFFSGITVRDPQQPIIIEGERAEALLRESLRYPTHDLQTSEMLFLYRTRQNQQSPTARPYLFFASGHLPYYGQAKFNVAHLDFGSWT